jgi:hypothetical protein
VVDFKNNLIHKMKRYWKVWLTLFTLTLFIISCDCRQSVSGTVLDQDTKQPIDSVFIFKQSKEYNNIYSDKKGWFEVTSISGGLFGCPPMTIELKREGYITKTVKIDNASNETIYLKRKSE